MDESSKSTEAENQIQKIAEKNCGQNRRKLVHKSAQYVKTPIYEQRFQNTEETSVTKN